MIKEIRFCNWKSFSDSVLYIDPLTVLIGTNASGKSNIVDGIAFLNSAAMGRNLQTALDGESGILLDGTVGAIRGGSEYAAMFPEDYFTMEVVVQKDEETDYKYRISVRTKPQVEVNAESLIKIIRNKTKLKETKLFDAYRTKDSDENFSPVIPTYINNGKGKPIRKDLKNFISVISQLKNYEIMLEVSEAIQLVVGKLEEIFILDPIPSLMRDYKPFSPYLSRNASNLAGMIAALPESKRLNIEHQLTQYVSSLPEGEVSRVWTEPVGKFKKDAMLYCEEKWGSNYKNVMIDARGMSDGTLRFIGILTALLTRPRGSLIVIEEVDNGLHPSRARLLLKILREIGLERNIDILITTHNPALMDELGVEMIPFIQVVHRDAREGVSRLTLLEDLNNLPKLLAHGSIGELSTKGDIEKSLSLNGGLLGGK
jgi:predicted ATPase